MSGTTPTVVVGVGMAGISIAGAIRDVVEERDDGDRFHYVCLDSDLDTLVRAPSDAATVALDPAATNWLVAAGGPRESYPYLTHEMDIEGKGTRRQRPVGRFKLDNADVLDDAFETLRTEIEAHVDRQVVGLEGHSACTLLLAHSFSGGTGSGTFPLVLGMLDRIAEDLPVDTIYTAGIGTVSLTLSANEDSPTELIGRGIYYPNEYAALRDLERLEALDWTDDSLELPVYTPESHRSVEPFTFDRPPFDDYWLVGVNERKIVGSRHGVDGRTYREQLNRTIGVGAHALTQESSLEAWNAPVSTIGTFDRATVRVPHERLRTYCERKAERDEIERRTSEEIPNEIETLERRLERLRTLRRDGAAAVDDAVRMEVAQRVDRLAVDEDATAEDATALFDDVAAERDVEGVLVATEALAGRLDEVAVDAADVGTLRRLRSAHGLEPGSRSDAGSTGVVHLQRRAEELVATIEERIEDATTVAEGWDPNQLDALRDALPPVVDALESDREAAERRLESLRADLDEARQLRAAWTRLAALQDATAERRRRARERLTDRIDETTRELDDLRDERETLSEATNRLDREIGDMVEELTTPSLSRQVAVLPLKRAALEDLDAQRLEQFDDMEAYVGELVDKEKTRNALSTRLEFAEAWNNPVIDGDFENVNVAQDELWFLHGETSGELLDTINTASDADVTKESGGYLPYLADPYRIEFVSFTRRSPVSGLKLYQVLSHDAETGRLAALADQYADWRHAFAYPEWYDRETQVPRDISWVTLTTPPELDPDRIDKPDLSAGELKNYVRRVGLNTYLWKGAMWDTYRASEDEQFDGWKEGLREKAVGFHDLERSTPDAKLTGEWLAGRAEWEDVVNAYRENLADRIGVEIEFEAAE
jgi:hypothetical protein